MAFYRRLKRARRKVIKEEEERKERIVQKAKNEKLACVYSILQKKEKKKLWVTFANLSVRFDEKQRL